MLDLVHFRKVDLGATEGMPPIRGVSNIEQQEFNFFFHPECNMVGLNDSYLLGRLGFPLLEEVLFTPDGTTKKLQIFRPARDTELSTPVDLHCQRCLMVSRSLEAARANKHACHFAIRLENSLGRFSLCSACLCALYYD